VGMECVEVKADALAAKRAATALTLVVWKEKRIRIGHSKKSRKRKNDISLKPIVAPLVAVKALMFEKICPSGGSIKYAPAEGVSAGDLE
jgi:hypothetical protein